jgi:hypothetical protein
MRQSALAFRVVTTVVACAAVLSACSPDDDTTDESSPQAAPAPSAAAPDAATEAASQPAPTPAAPPSEPVTAGSEPGEALATASVPIDFVDGGELQMAVTALDVTGELMRVAITFTASLPATSEPVAVGAVLTANENAPAAGISPEVIDPVNLKAYELVAGGIPNGTAVDLVDGSPRTIVCYYAAPQDDVETLDIVVASQAPTLTDIPFAQ